MRLGGSARFLCEIYNEEGLIEALDYAKNASLKYKVIGSGSNLIWPDHGYSGLIIVNKISGYSNKESVVTIGAGMSWDEAVMKTVDSGLSGIEQLSLIPGTTGATPVQNVGAYGREISDVLISLRVYDSQLECFDTLSSSDCDFGYRSSRFNGDDEGRFIIISITLQLTTEHPKPPFYDSLQRYLDEHDISNYTPQNIRDAVIAVRTAKLPDPDVISNNGSFFANPIIDTDEFKKLVEKYPQIVSWKHGESVKLSAAWLIEQAGFKDFHDAETGMATWATQPLVLINEHAKSTADLQRFKTKIVQAVEGMFDITLIQEPELVD